MSGNWSRAWCPSDGEIHFLWHFMQGSVMDPYTRRSLRRAWGMCPRHTFGWLAVESSFRLGYLHGPAVLYEDLMTRAAEAFPDRGPASRLVTARRIRPAEPCLMCSAGFGPTSPGLASAEVLERGRDIGPIREFAFRTSRWWRVEVCGRCARTSSVARCRIHLREDLLEATTGVGEHRKCVLAIAERMRKYARSFRWEYRDTETEADRAALVSAAGWCSGWEPWLWVTTGKGGLDSIPFGGQES